MGWWKYVGHNGGIIGVDRFGASAPGPIVMEKLGVSVAHIVELAKKLVKK
jgi:transketolase